MASSSSSVARRSHRKPVESDDVVMLRAAELAEWARKNAQAIIIGVAVLVLAAGAMLYYQMYKSQRAERASIAYLELQGALTPADSAGSIRRLEQFANTYPGTSEGAQARILAAQLYMGKGQANKAVEVVRPAADGGTPVAPQARMVYAAALANAGKRQEAIDTYVGVANGTELNYVKQDALTQAAVLHEQANNRKGAADLSRQIVATTEKGSPDRAVAEMHMAEAEAHAASGSR